MAINIHETERDESTAKDNTFFFNVTAGGDITNNPYNSKQSAIEGARAHVREIFKVFGLPAPDMSGKDWYNDFTRDDR